MSDLFKNSSFNFKCPKCDGTFTVLAKQVGTHINCNHCGQPIFLEDSGFSQGLQDVNKKINDIFKKFK